jgi:2-phospho-L-lactate guanylyltransferase
MTPARKPAVVVPLRAFAAGKARLAGRLDEEERAALGRRMAERVVAAAGLLDIAIVSNAPEVREWATGLGHTVLADPGNLDAAATVGAQWATRLGSTRLAVVHADLPCARSVEPVLRDGGLPIVTIVPCHRDDGTPAISLPLPLPAAFRFAYGAGSFRRHVANAHRAGLAVRVIRDRDLGFDVDLPDDLDALTACV